MEALDRPAEDSPINSILLDELTGLPNRTFLLKRLEETVAQYQNNPNHIFALLFLDCDHFNLINDSLGHAVADKVLRSIATRLRTNLLDTATLTRLGGDEFAILQEHSSGLTSTLRIAEVILQSLQTPIVLDGREVFMSVSIGITTSESGYTAASDMMRDADTALHHAKTQGRGRYAVFDPHMHARMIWRLEATTELRRMLEHQELCVYYQPIVSLINGTLTGFEALVRWNHPQRGVLVPGEFLPLAEEMGLGVEIDRRVLYEACRQLKQWQTSFAGFANLTVSVNLSWQHLVRLDLVRHIRTMLHEIGLEAHCLKLEITENTLIEHPDTVVLTLKHLHDLGVQVSLDDFGTGYSSFHYLQHMQINTLKIDRSFVSGIDVEVRTLEVVRAIIALAHNLGMDVVSEGIETAEHLDQLRLLGSEHGQGFFFAKPMRDTEAEQMLREQAQRWISEKKSAQARSRHLEHFEEQQSSDKAVLPPDSAHDPVQASPADNPPSAVTRVKLSGEHRSQLRDPLTGLLSRAAFDIMFQETLEQSERASQPFALVMLDLDHFKSVNDAFGHARGDQVLKEFAQRAMVTIRSTDLVFRYGGDEFVLLLPNTNRDRAVTFTQRLLDTVRSQPFDGNPPLSLTTSMGVALYPIDGSTAATLFEVADQRNYQAKRAGRGCAICEDSIQPDAVSIDGPLRLLERDRPLDVLHDFLDVLPAFEHGLLEVIGCQGVGATRFLDKASDAARLQGYAVLMIRGSAALKERVFGVLTELPPEWQSLPLPCTGVDHFASIIQQVVSERKNQGMIIILDDVSDIDPASLIFLTELFQSMHLPCQGMIYATSKANQYQHLPREAAIRMQVMLEPLSLTGVRTWLRHSLNWEVPQDLLIWFYQQTGGLPGSIRRGLAYLLEQDILRIVAGKWSHDPDIATIPLADLLKDQTSELLHNLPTGLNEFVGREDDIKRLKQLLRQQSLVTVLGPGGSGKTRLAIQAAAESLKIFSDGVCFVALAALTSPAFLVYAIADALGLALAGANTPAEQVIDYLRARNMLLVLDNFEHIREGTFFLQEIRDQAPGIHLLVTSRDRLPVPDIIQMELAGLDMPEDLSIDDLEAYTSFQLFLRRAHQGYADFTAAPADRLHIAHICRLVEGMPLGIELAAGWVRTFTCEDIARRIEQNLAFLSTDHPDVPEKHRSLVAMLDSFWCMLSPNEQSILRRITIFRGGFSGSAADQVAGASPFFLDALVSKGYLHWSRHRRYELHELLRQYAAAKLHTEAHEENQVQENHAMFYLQALQERETITFGSRYTLKEIWVDLDNMRLAWSWVVAQIRLDTIERSMEGLAAFYHVHGLFHEAEAIFQHAADYLQRVAAERNSEDQSIYLVIGRLLAFRAQFLIRLSRYATAIDIAQAVLDLASTSQIISLQALAQYYYGEALWQSGEYDDAWQHLNHAVTLAQTGNMPALEADSLRKLSRVACDQGRYADARDLAEQALRLCREMGDRHREARSLNDLGIVADSQADYITSRSHYEHCLRLAREIGDQHSEGNALLNLGAVYADQGNYAETRTVIEQALRIFRESGDRRNEGIALENLGDNARMQGDLVTARRYYEQTLRICREIGDKQGESYMLSNLGLLAHQRGDDQVARSLCEQALQIAEAMGDSRARGQALVYLGHALTGLEFLAEAIEMYQQALHLYREIDLVHLSMDVLAGLARVALMQGNIDQAVAYVELIEQHLKYAPLDGTAEPFRVYLTCYRVLKSNNSPHAHDLLHTAWMLLHTRAARITEEGRQRMFLEHVPAHRALLQAAEAAGIHG